MHISEMPVDVLSKIVSYKLGDSKYISEIELQQKVQTNTK